MVLRARAVGSARQQTVAERKWVRRTLLESPRTAYAGPRSLPRSTTRAAHPTAPRHAVQRSSRLYQRVHSHTRPAASPSRYSVTMRAALTLAALAAIAAAPVTALYSASDDVIHIEDEKTFEKTGECGRWGLAC